MFTAVARSIIAMQVEGAGRVATRTPQPHAKPQTVGGQFEARQMASDDAPTGSTPHNPPLYVSVMHFIDQTNSRRFAYVCLIAYAVSAMVGGSVPFLTVGLFPDTGGDPLAFQRKIAAMVELMNYARMASVVSGGVAIVAIAAWIQGAYRNLEALPSTSAPMHRWLAVVLVLIPGINLVGGPVVMWKLLDASKRGAGRRGDWFRFGTAQLVGVWVAVMLASAAITAYVLLSFEPSTSASQLASLQLTLLVVRVLDIVFAGITAMILHRVDQLQEAARASAVPDEVFE
ncbi:MAG: DUF4328 domain-containing protein [Myxococcota bacterium]